ncbi:lipocalin family protein [Flavobacterium sp. JAS]|uniref:lipocalin family protein n=1 Tax=Flavobacterium sp. JAS TaxID=2897329 RepID=UPI001E657DC9|nr:lipocalin family protein [Flavobacterium sp. JAS]MCD0471433.1 lipocalin family protein [Flavobacterium sp. JAS]
MIPLESKWDLVKVGTVVDGVENLTDPPQNASGCRKDYLDLKLDNTATMGDYDSTISACALTETKGIYSRSHNDLTISISGTTQVSDIMNLTNKELKLKNKATGVISVYSR